MLQPDPPPETPAENKPARLPAPTGDTPAQTIARLTAERDAAQCEREIEADYREALLRDLDVFSRQLKETQRRLNDLEQSAHSPGDTPNPPGDRERWLEHELEEARSRICQLESMAAPKPYAHIP
jgi:hypothetical protein